jgi:hypothetical protein
VRDTDNGALMKGSSRAVSACVTLEADLICHPCMLRQLPSGSWRVKACGETDPLTGREIRLRKTCKTERPARIELGKLLEQAAAGRQPETNATAAELMDQYAEVTEPRRPTATCRRGRRTRLTSGG